MHMATKTQSWTRSDLARLPDDGNRYEVLDGQLYVTPLPAFPHQAIAMRLGALLLTYVDRHRLGIVVGPGSVIVGDDELQPDVAVFPVTAPRLGQKWKALPRPLLVVEVLSHTTRRRDLEFKRRAYQAWRIPTYWVIDRFEPRALVWSPTDAASTIVTDALRWRPRQDVDALVVSLADIGLGEPA